MSAFFLRSRTGRRYKNSLKCRILFRPGSSLTNPISILSEYKESPKHVQSSLGAHTYRQHCAKKMKLELRSLEPNPLNKGSQESRDKMSLTCHTNKKRVGMSRHQVKWQKWRNVVVRHTPSFLPTWSFNLTCISRTLKRWASATRRFSFGWGCQRGPKISRTCQPVRRTSASPRSFI